MENRFRKARTVYNQHGAQSTQEVAKETGVTKSLIEDIESTVGKPRNVGYLTVKKLAQHYSVSTDYLLGISDTPSTKEDIQAACKTTGLSEDAIYFLKEVWGNRGCDGPRVFKAINALLSEANYNECFDFWERISTFLFSSDMPYNLQAGETFRKMDAETVLSLLLSQNEQLLRKMRREIQNGKHHKDD